MNKSLNLRIILFIFSFFGTLYLLLHKVIHLSTFFSVSRVSFTGSVWIFFSSLTPSFFCSTVFFISIILKDSSKDCSYREYAAFTAWASWWLTLVNIYSISCWNSRVSCPLSLGYMVNISSLSWLLTKTSSGSKTRQFMSIRFHSRISISLQILTTMRSIKSIPTSFILQYMSRDCLPDMLYQYCAPPLTKHFSTGKSPGSFLLSIIFSSNPGLLLLGIFM